MGNDEEFTNKKSRFNPIPVDYPILSTIFLHRFAYITLPLLALAG